MELNWALAGIVILLLTCATAVGKILKRQSASGRTGINPAALASFNSRLKSWWIICCLLTLAFISHGQILTVLLFGSLSFWALREFITLTPTRMGDHRALFWVFAFFTPLQYLLVAYDNYALYSIFIPVFAFLFIPARVAIEGDPKRFLERVAKIQSGLLICVYCLSFAPAILYLDIPDVDYSGKSRLLFFFVTMCLLSEAMQFIAGRLYGRHVIAPAINGAKTWEGLIGGSAAVALVGMAISWATPFELWEAALMSVLIAIMGFAGGMTMSAIKRDRGVKDYGTLVEGHGGLLDRIDVICFAAPVFYHVVRHLL